jgi:hypothetical protein
MLKQKRSWMKVFSAIFCPERVLSILMFLYFLQGEHRQISQSGDLEKEQGTRDIAVLHPGQDLEFFSRFFWKRKSRAFSMDAVARW